MVNDKLIIFIPGIMGSELKKESYKVWPRFFKYKKAYEENLPLGKSDLVPGQPIKFVYGKILNSLERVEGYDFVSFAYDWRQEISVTAQLFDQFLMSYNSKKEIIIVAHSMGGLLAKLTINKHEDGVYKNKIKKIITLGTPWYGSMDSYKTLKYGNSIDFFKYPLVITKELSKDLSKGFPSTYQLLPHSLYFSRVQESYNVEAYTIQGEQLNDFESLYKKQLMVEYEGIVEDYPVTSTFYEFHDYINRETQVEHHEIVGVGRLSIVSINENAFDEVNATRQDGDGVVPRFSAVSGSANKNYFIPNAMHQKLPKYPNVIELIKRIINNEVIKETDNVLLKESSLSDKGFKGNVVKIACPVDVSIMKNGKSIYGVLDELESEEELIEDLKGIEVEEMGNTVYLIFDESNIVSEESHSIYIDAYDEGLTNVSLERYDKGILQKSVAFESFNISPKFTANLNVESNINESELKVFSQQNSVQKIKSIEIKDDAFIFPETSFSMDAQKIKSQDVYVSKGNIELTIQILKGTYEVKDTYVRYDGNEYRIEGSSIDLHLSPGENHIELFSVDILGNTEPAQKFMIYSLDSVNPKIEYEFFPNRYYVKIKENSHVKFLIDEYNINPSRVEIKIEPESQKNNTVFIKENENEVIVLMNDLTQRSIEIIYKTFLGEEEIKLCIDEYSLENIFNGLAGAQTLQEILQSLQIKEPLKVKMHKIEGFGRPYSVINDSNLLNAKKIIISDLTNSLEITKTSEYFLRFYNLDETINVASKDDYEFYFKIFDKEGNEVKDLNVETFLKVLIVDSDFIDVNNDYDKEKEMFKGIVKIDDIKKILDQHWKETKIHSIELIISKEGQGGYGLIRTKELSVINR